MEHVATTWLASGALKPITFKVVAETPRRQT
jgi:hypothetical protein